MLKEGNFFLIHSKTLILVSLNFSKLCVFQPLSSFDSARFGSSAKLLKSISFYALRIPC